MQPPIKVLYILGSARSGSTLIEGVLNQAADVASYGEVVWFWSQSMPRDDRCACGELISKCELWTSVTAPWPDLDAHARRMVDLAHRVQRRRHVPLLLGYSDREWHRQPLAEYTTHLAEVYRRLARPGTRIVVDSSKSPYYALVLTHVKSIEPYFLHLVRDSRATAHSWMRVKPRPDLADPTAVMERWPPRRSAWNWLTDHIASLIIGRSFPHYTRIRYEDFVAAPHAVLGTALAELGLDLDLSGVLATDAYERPSHAVGGNPARFSPDWLKIRADEEWRTALAPNHLLQVTAMTWPLLLWFGYPLSRLRPARKQALKIES